MESDLYEMSKSGVINESSNILSSTSARGTRKENLEYLASMLSSRRDGKLRQSSGLILDGGDDDPKSRTKAFRFGGVPSAYAPKPAAAPKQHSLGFRKYAPLYDVAVWSDFTVNARLSPPPSLSCPDKKSRLEPRPAIAIRPSARRETGPAARALAPAEHAGVRGQGHRGAQQHLAGPRRPVPHRGGAVHDRPHPARQERLGS